MTKTALLCAGGTGGHLFPAQALASELVSRGWSVHLATDDRGTRYSDKFDNDGLHVIASATFGSKNPIAIAKAAFALFQGYRASKALIKKLKVDVAIGFGGYPSIPPMVAAQRTGVPTVLHEQNAVLGRANKFLAKNTIAVAAGFSSESLPQDTVITGNPLREEILEIANRLDKSETPYTTSNGHASFNLLVVGGSQGAQYFGETVPQAVVLLPADLRKRIRLTLQTRAEQVDQVKKLLSDNDISAEVAPFFDKMGQRLENAQLIISRAGASTVSEIAAVGRPSILVPYPYALDHDQAANAAELVERGGGMVVPQAELTAQVLADKLSEAMTQPDALKKQAHAAAMTGQPRATKQLADLVAAVGEKSYLGAGLASKGPPRRN